MFGHPIRADQKVYLAAKKLAEFDNKNALLPLDLWENIKLVSNGYITLSDKPSPITSDNELILAFLGQYKKDIASLDNIEMHDKLIAMSAVDAIQLFVEKLK